MNFQNNMRLYINVHCIFPTEFLINPFVASRAYRRSARVALLSEHRTIHATDLPLSRRLLREQLVFERSAAKGLM